MQEDFCIHAVVSGHVQGVWYRESTRRQAEALCLTGWVKNLPNGTVELMAHGEEKQVMQLIEWLWQGPPAAHVEHVEWSEEPPEVFEQFRVL